MRQLLADIKFRQPRIWTDKDGKRSVVSRLTKDDVRLEVDEDLGIIYIKDERYSIHNADIDCWRPIGSAGADAVRKPRAK